MQLCHVHHAQLRGTHTVVPISHSKIRFSPVDSRLINNRKTRNLRNHDMRAIYCHTVGMHCDWGSDGMTSLRGQSSLHLRRILNASDNESFLLIDTENDKAATRHVCERAQCLR